MNFEGWRLYNRLRHCTRDELKRDGLSACSITQNDNALGTALWLMRLYDTGYIYVLNNPLTQEYFIVHVSGVFTPITFNKLTTQVNFAKKGK